jgi:hypothetical protein
MKVRAQRVQAFGLDPRVHGMQRSIRPRDLDS